MKALSIENLVKTYGGKVQALKGVSFDVEEGDFFALLGPNGAGKSTLIGILTCLVNKTSGKVVVCGHDLDKDPGAVKSCLGVVPQEFNFNVFESVQNTVLYQAGYYGIPRNVAYPRTRRLLESLDLWEKRDEPGRNLSGGMKRRLMLARALVNEPRVLVLDEPTAGLDIELRRSLWEFLIDLNAGGTTIILTTHYLEEAENLCRHVAIIDHGELLELSPINELLKKLDRQAFVLETRQPIEAAPELDGFPTRLMDDHRLIVEVTSRQSLNQVFALLGQRGIEIVGMRPKTNRLEELFIDLTRRDR